MNAMVIPKDREAAWPFRADCYGHLDKNGWMNGKYDHNRVIQAFAAHRLATSAPAVDAVPAGEVLPRLTRSMMKAACKAHYGDDNIDGIDLTADSVNYTFAQGFARMWKGIRAALSHGEGRK